MIKHSGVHRESWHYFDLGWEFRATLLRLGLMDLKIKHDIKY